jgi:hypothetical protein
MSDLNQSALKKHALKCSKEVRNGRFTRVGADFLDELNADVEAIVRDLRNVRFPIQVNGTVPSDESFVTGPLLEKMREALNQAVARLVQNKVQKQPSVGTTLGRTR